MARFDSTMFSAETFTSLIRMVVAAILIKDGEVRCWLANTAANAHDYAVRTAPVFTKRGARKALVSMRGEVAHIKLAEHDLQLPQCNRPQFALFFCILRH